MFYFIMFLLLVTQSNTKTLVPRKDLLELAYSSPAQVLAKDKEQWLNLFSEDVVLVDPEGSWEAVGRYEGLSQFWDGLIHPTIQVNFTKVLQPDIVSNYSQCSLSDCHAVVARSVEITTVLPVKGVQIKLYPIILYTLVATPVKTITIADERTYWPLLDQVTQLLDYGSSGYLAMAKFGLSMVQAMGLVNTTQYFINGATKGISQDFGKSTVETLCSAITERDFNTFSSLFLNVPSATRNASLSFPIGTTYTELIPAWKALEDTKIRMTGTVQTAGVFAAVGLQLEHTSGAQIQTAILRVEFEQSHGLFGKIKSLVHKQSYLIKSIEFFWDF